MRPDTLQALLAERAAKRPVVLATAVDGEGAQRLLQANDADPLAAEAAIALRLDQARSVEHAGSTWFLRPYNPPLRLLLVGAVHISQPLAVIAREAGYAVTIIDPRAAFAAAARSGDIGPVPPIGALRTMRVLDAAREAAETGHTVDITD